MHRPGSPGERGHWAHTGSMAVLLPPALRALDRPLSCTGATLCRGMGKPGSVGLAFGPSSRASYLRPSALTGGGRDGLSRGPCSARSGGGDAQVTAPVCSESPVNWPMVDRGKRGPGGQCGCGQRACLEAGGLWSGPFRVVLREVSSLLLPTVRQPLDPMAKSPPSRTAFARGRERASRLDPWGRPVHLCGMAAEDRHFQPQVGCPCGAGPRCQRSSANKAACDPRRPLPLAAGPAGYWSLCRAH